MDFVLNKIDKHLHNHISLDQNMKDLKRKLEDLNALKEDIESKMRAELQPRKKLKKQVHLWLGNIERINGEIRNLEETVAESSTVSRGFHMANVLKKIQEVEDLLQKGKFDQGVAVDDLMWIGQALSTTNLVGKAAENYDLWDKLSLEEVGIPQPSNGSKLVVTTRMLDVCRYLGCREIRMPTLPKQDAWSLFLEKVGRDVLNYPDLLPIVESVVEQCAGLPLAIVTVASSMKGITNVHEWRNALNELSRCVRGVTGLDEKVLQQLQFSYDHLNDERVQHCFLCCALYPEDHNISEFNLIKLWIAEGLVEEMDSQRAEFDQGYTILNKLKNNCLLENGESIRRVKLHDLVRDMALHITRQRFLVRAGMQLKEIPHKREWTEDLEKVSLMRNRDLQIPSQMSPPKCQMLTTLLLSYCGIRSIPDCFFEQMKGLQVLNLSGNNFTILPSSISNLEALTVLLVRRCRYLEEVPSFSKLEALKKLDLDRTPIKNLPHGMERLVNLNYLHLNMEEIPSGILSKLSCLRDLLMVDIYEQQVCVRGEEIGELRKLAYFEGRFYDLNEYHTFLQALQSRGQRLIGYHIGVGHEKVYSEHNWDKHIDLNSCKICRDGVKFPSDLQQLSIYYDIVDFPEEEKFFPWFVPTPNGLFSFLKEINIYECEKIKKLFSCSWVLSNVPNLEVLTVWGCDQMEEIIASEIEFFDEEGMGGNNSNTSQFVLLKLRKLELWFLPELKSICSTNRVMICDSLKEIRIEDCPKLQRIPLYSSPA
ncbi:Nbs-lrr resistance protein [Theobroma cacao]|uniref:Nbs-lrr resistance protein n=1 Tax=Theobroma cacao TaxID=3641 RepID=A0A061F689_THECC|nr:Nbs-lrr resistance protein [Theobroma cacao]